MALQSVNNLEAESTFDGAVAIDATTFDCATGEGADFPDTNGVIEVVSTGEFIWYDARSGDTFTGVVKGFDDSTPAAYTGGEAIRAVLTAAWFTEVAARQTLPTEASATDEDFLQFTTSATLGSQYSGSAPTITGSGVAFGTPANVWPGTGGFVKLNEDGYIHFDFGAPVRFGRLLFDAADNTTNVPQWVLLEYSVDNSAWETAGQVYSGIDGLETDIVLDFLDVAPEAQYWRFTLIEGLNNTTGAVDNFRFYEASIVPSWVSVPAATVAAALGDDLGVPSSVFDLADVVFSTGESGTVLVTSGENTLGSAIATSPEPYITASSVYGSGYSGRSSWPGVSGNYVSGAGSGTWVEYDWKENGPVTLGKVVFDSPHASYYMTEAAVEYWDGAQWVRIAEASGFTGSSTDNEIDFTASATSATRWRLVAVATASDARFELNDVVWYEATVGVQFVQTDLPLALPTGASPGDTVAYEAGVPETLPMEDYTVAADYTYSTQTADKAVDNDPGTYWQDNGNNGAFRVDLGAAETIERIKVAFEAQAANWNGKTVRISYSDTAITGPWTVEGTYLVGDVHDIDGTSNPGWPIELSSPATHRFWRLDSMGAWTKLYWLEFQKSGTAAWSPVTLPTAITDLDVGGSAPADTQLLQYNASSEVETVKSDIFRTYCDNIYQGQSPDILIDGTSSTMQTGGTATKYIIFDYGAGNAKTVTRLILETDSTLGTWKVEGSNDLSSWTELETGIVNTAVDTEESFDLSTTGSYRYYRISATSGAAWTILRTMIPVYTVGQWVPLSLADLKTALDALA